MPMIGYDGSSFSIDGRRVWLASGAIHYFRVPHQLWRDRLLKAKRAGLNCIETYAAWNLHEPADGKWDFAGDCDIRQFVTLAKELGLYCILRPGPYICSEWDFGGLPAWLMGKSGIAFRTSNATFMHYFDRYFRQLLPRLADLQVTRGGNILLVQNENEYYFTPMPDRLSYCQFISQLIRRAGFDVPIITCNWLAEPRVPDAIECFNGRDRAVQLLKRLRSQQPAAPLVATEFWTGNSDWWGGEHRRVSPRQTARIALEMLGCGCQVNQYMFHGGTNFGFWAARLGESEASYHTTSYDCDAPVAEGGGLTPKYYLLKLVNMLATHMGELLAQMRMQGPGVTTHGGLSVLNLAGPAGRLAVVTNNGQSELKEAAISLPDGRDLTVSLEPLDAVAVPIGLRLGGDCVLDYANLMPLGMFGKTLVLHGPPGWKGRLSVNGVEADAIVPEGEAVVQLEHQGRKVLVMNSTLAQRAWEVGDSLIIGPEFVGETAEDAVMPAGAQDYTVVSAEGQVSRRKARRSAGRTPAAPNLGEWARVVCEEPVNEKLVWERIDRPRDLVALGAAQGYGWYRAEVESAKPGRRLLVLPECEDRATLYLNGGLIGIWGRGPQATRRPIAATFKAGRNVLVALLDNLGRPCFGPHLGQQKGLFGHVYEARPLKQGAIQVRKGAEFTRRLLPRMYTHMAAELEGRPVWTAELTFQITGGVRPVMFSYTGIPHTTMILCNGRQVGFMPAMAGGGYFDATLTNELQSKTNRLTLLVWSEARPVLQDCLQLELLAENLTRQAAWSFRKWAPATGKTHMVGKDLPAWYTCRFRSGPTAQPLFLHVTGVQKGQLLLNGHNVGRFWNIGPQAWYYLPEPWLTGEDELVIFDEQGLSPSGTRLEYRPLGPYAKPGEGDVSFRLSAGKS